MEVCHKLKCYYLDMNIYVEIKYAQNGIFSQKKSKIKRSVNYASSKTLTCTRFLKNIRFLMLE